MLERVYFTISEAMSVSVMRDVAADRFSWETLRLRTALSKRFWIAPRLARALEIAWICVSILSICAAALAAES